MARKAGALWILSSPLYTTRDVIRCSPSRFNAEWDTELQPVCASIRDVIPIYEYRIMHCHKNDMSTRTSSCVCACDGWFVGGVG